MVRLVDMKRSLVALALGLVSARCHPCNAPATTIYSCKTIDAGSEGCHGGPSFGSDGGRDPGLIFPLGCAAELPLCNPYYGNTQAQTCGCEKLDGTDAGPQWLCPI